MRKDQVGANRVTHVALLTVRMCVNPDLMKFKVLECMKCMKSRGFVFDVLGEKAELDMLCKSPPVKLKFQT